MLVESQTPVATCTSPRSKDILPGMSTKRGSDDGLTSLSAEEEDDDDAEDLSVPFAATSVHNVSGEMKDIRVEFRKSIIQPRSFTRSMSSSARLKMEQEFTVNKLRFDNDSLYGRTQEQELLKGYLKRATTTGSTTSSMGSTAVEDSRKRPLRKQQQQRGLVLIQGLSGTGKSSLAETLRRPTKHAKGVYISGKFDLNRRDEPFGAISAACGELCADIIISRQRNRLGGSFDTTHNSKSSSKAMKEEDTIDWEARFIQLRNTIIKELGPELSVLTRVIPILDEIVGDGGTSSEDSSKVKEKGDAGVKSDEDNLYNHRHPGFEEAKNRFHYVFRRFMRIIGSYYAAVVLVLDDLQWAEAASLALLEVLITDRQNPNLVLIGCYRSNEVDESHLLTKTINNLKEKKDEYEFQTAEIALENLSLFQVNQMIMDLLSITDESETMGLARVCHKRCLGNPFFLRSFLTMLNKELLLDYNFGVSRWLWDEDEIEHGTQATWNVVDMMKLRMNKMSSSEVKLVQVAACLGSTFSERILACVWENLFKDVDKAEHKPVGDLLQVAVEEGFLVQSDRIGEFRWVHDNIQQSACSLTSPEELSVLQYRVGEILVSELNEKELGTTVFVAVNLLNERSTPVDSQQGVRWAEVNLRAARKAVELAAMESAAKYAIRGIQYLLFSKDYWRDQYHLTLQLYSTAAQAEGYLGQVDAMERHCNVVLAQRGVILMDKLCVYNVLMDSIANQNRTIDARELCIDVLAKLGCEFPRSQIIRALRIATGLRKLRKRAKSRTAKNLAKATMMEDPLIVESMKLLEKLATYCYITNDWSLYFLVVLREIEWTDRFGLSETSAHGFACAGLLLSNFVGDPQQGSIYGEHALQITEKLKTKRLEAQSKFVVYTYVLHWTQPSHLGMRPLLQGYESGLEAGDLEYAMYGVVGYLTCALLSGRSLVALEADCRLYVQQMQEFKREFTERHCIVLWQTVLNLLGQSNDPTILNGEALQQDDFRKTANPLHLSVFHCCLSQLYMWFGKHDLGAELAVREFDSMAKTNPGSILVTVDCFAKGMSLFAMARQTKSSKFAKLGKKALKTIARWAKGGNPNVRHYQALLEAELAAYQTRDPDAKKQFEVAVSLSSRGGFIQDAALAHERYGEYLLAHNDREEATFRFGEAVKLYRDWGAHAKVVQLEKQHPELGTSSKDVF